MKKIILILGILLSNSSNIFPQCFIKDSDMRSQYHIVNTSGNHQIDNLFYTNNQYLASILGLSVDVGYYKDTHYSPNAFAMAAKNNYTHGQVYFGVYLLNKYYNETYGNVQNNMFRILAHEYAHVLQYSKGGPKWQKTK